MANNTVYPYGTGGQLPSGIPIADDLNTDRADMALSAKQGKILGDMIGDSLDAGSDLEVADEEGFVLAQFKEGQFKTKEFDSRDLSRESFNTDNDFEIADNNGAVLVQFKNGHIMTKNFDSSNISESSLPNYWKTYLDAKSASLNSKNLSLGRDGFSFVFVTDTHWNDNAKNSPAVIKYLQENVGIGKCIFGGDMLVGHGERSAKLEEMFSFVNSMRDLHPVMLVGNHDYNTSDQPSSQNTYLTDPNLISPGEFYRICNVPKERIVHYSRAEVTGQFDEYFGYEDNDDQKIRFIYLDSGAVYKKNWADTNLRLSSTQVDWMKARITELPAGWSAIVFTHIFFQPGSTVTTHGIGTQIETALDSIYDTADAKIIGVVCGHVHQSASKVSAKGYPIIATTTDSAGQSNRESLTYSRGTDTEQAFDVYFVNTENRTIDVVRIGAGDTTKDRTFNY